ncbi:MAG: sulfur carrier protein ThiS [Moraxellaceae bacterium]|jgi:sulfur carrier protein|nr:sulfur carrier protein ThiS [Moraxellaceae bacterium]
MQIQLNGEPRDIAERATLAALIAELELAGKRIAVELNGEIAPRSQHGTICLQPGDRVEIVQAIGGG